MKFDINHGSTLLARRSSHYKTLFEPLCKLENRLVLYTHAGKRVHILDEIHDLYSSHFMHWESSNLPLAERLAMSSACQMSSNRQMRERWVLGFMV